jgi:hypothetical protein
MELDTPEVSRPKQIKCSDCGLLIDEDDFKCLHCDALNPRQLSILKYKLRVNKRENSKIGKFFFCICLIILILFLSL